MADGLDYDYDDVCEHLDVGDGYCLDCGMIMKIEYDFTTEYSKNYTKMNSAKVPILDIIENIPKVVIDKAKDNIRKFQEETGHKIRNDAKNMFIILYNAYLDLEMSCFPAVLAENLGLSKKDINHCLKESSGTSLKTKNDDKEYKAVVLLSPVNFIEEICITNKIREHVDELKRITREILEKKDNLYSLRPINVAVSIVKKYSTVNSLGLKNLTKNYKISENAIKRITNDIEFFFNT
jgi:hypothetical protein